MTDKIITRPTTDEYRDNWERIFGRGYIYKTYAIDGAIRAPEIQQALERSMRLMHGVGAIRAGKA